MSNNEKALKSGVWYTVSNLLVRNIGLLTTPIFTRILSKADYGNYNNYLSWQGIILIVVTLNLEASLISAKFDYKDNFKEYIFSVLSLSTVSVVIWTIIFNLFQNSLSDFLGMSPVYLNIIMLYCCFNSSVNMFQVSERFQYKYKSAVFIAILTAVGTAGLSLIMVFSMDNKLMGRTLGGVLPVALIGLVLYVIIAYQGKHIDVQTWKYALKICIPYIPHLLSLTVLNTMDRVMIKRICGAEDNALYSLAYNCGAMVTILLTSMNTAFSPWLGDNLHENNYEDTRRVSKYYMLSFCYLAIGIMLLAPEVLLIMGGRSYLEAKYVMTPVAMGCVCQFMYTMYVNVEQYKKKTIGMAFASMGAALVNLVLNLVFIPVFGYIAAAYTTLVGFLFLLIVHMLLVKRIGCERVYDNKMTLVVMIAMMACAVGINFLYMNNLARYIVIAGYAVGTVILFYNKRKIIMNLLSKIVKRG